MICHRIANNMIEIIEDSFSGEVIKSRCTKCGTVAGFDLNTAFHACNINRYLNEQKAKDSVHSFYFPLEQPIIPAGDWRPYIDMKELQYEKVVDDECFYIPVSQNVVETLIYHAMKNRMAEDIWEDADFRKFINGDFNDRVDAGNVIKEDPKAKDVTVSSRMVWLENIAPGWTVEMAKAKSTEIQHKKLSWYTKLTMWLLSKF